MVRKLIIAALMSISLKMAVCQPRGGNTIKIANVERDAVYTQDSVYVVSDAHFRKKSTDRWLLGNHYRREWSMPVKVPNILLDTFQGGAYVIKESGGKQTKTLRLQLDHDYRKQYLLRSVEKYPEKALPAEFEGTLATRLVKDQISSAHPFAAIVVTPLAAAAEILHTNPQMVFISSSPRLQKFDSQYGNRFYLLEERPHGNWEETSFFGHASNIISTERLRLQLQESASTPVDQRAFLRARLLDLLIGDWDRHEEQWAWANVKRENTIFYQPVPKDRDQAFANLDGVLPWLGRRKWAFRRGQHFTSTIKDIRGLTWSARNLDRLLLNSLDWKDWFAEVQFLKTVWTNDIIEKSLQRLPPELYHISGPSIVQKLINRRNHLENFAYRFYTTLAAEVEWTGTNLDDIFTIKYISDSTFAVSQLSSEETNAVCARQRVFNTKETKVVTIYGLKGNDDFIYEGEKSIPIRFRFIGGEGKNRYLAPELAERPSVKVFDRAIPSQKDVKPFRLKRRYDSLTHDYHYNHHPYSILKPFFLPAYNPDDGILIGAGISYNRSQWGHFPYSQHHIIKAGYAFRTKAYHFTYEGMFKKVVGQWDIVVDGQLHQPGYGQNFYGLGNETKLTTKNRDYNRVRIDQIQMRAGLQRTINTIHTIRFLGEFLSVHVQENDKRFVSKSNPQLDSTDFLKTVWVGGTFAYELNTRNDPFFPTRGLRWRNELSYLGANKGARNIVRPASSLSAYIPLGSVVLAARVGGAALWGEPHFFQYNQLSSLDNLRGYRRSRFSGKSMLFTNSELRVPLTYVKGLFVNGQMGTLLFLDNGRVWIPDEKSNQWHWGYGAGLWLIPFDRIAIVAQMGFSGEDKIFTLKTGFLF